LKHQKNNREKNDRKQRDGNKKNYSPEGNALFLLWGPKIDNNGNN